ncbi:hypothetical protein [Actinomadura yumaensis]|uniref:Helix-turn-helix domain-containing protein n=1 Tax=Actinomadura yumaensis TaxID=111807 RepID=A0ABW2CNR3_9ACTN
MASDTTPRPGRPLKLLDDEVREQLLEAISHGATIESAVAAAGIGVTTFYRWMERGEQALQSLQDGEEPKPSEEPFREFREAVTRAHARGEVFNADLLRKIAVGGFVVKTRTKRYRDPASGQVVEEREDDIAPPDLRAVTFYLERRHGGSWGKASALEVSGPGGGPVEVAGGAGLAALAERVAESLEEYRAELEAGGGDVVDGVVVEDGPDGG